MVVFFCKRIKRFAKNRVITAAAKKGEKDMKKTIKTRIFTGFLCLVTIFTTSAATASSAFAAEQSEVSVSKYKEDTIYYSDEYFRHSSTQYDPHLATLSCIMTNYSIPLDNPSSTDDEHWYQSQPERLQGFFNNIGFEDFKCNKDYTSRSAFDTIGVAAACKKVDDCTVIGVGIRSGGYFREWANNVWLGDGTKSDYMHEGWYNAANKTIEFLKEYISSKEITGKIKVWIAGFSRGGATANLTAGLLDNALENNAKVLSDETTLTRDDLYAYTFEAPQGANYNSKTVKLPGDPIYNNIWNVVNPNDLVPKVAMREYGFTRFGTDKFITTKFYDPKNFESNREVFKAMYAANSQPVNDYKADNFEMYGTPLKNVAALVAELVTVFPVGAADIISQIHDGKIPALEKDNTKANYDANISTYLLLEEITKNIGSRDDYCSKYQSGVSNFLLVLMNDVGAMRESELYCILSKLLLCATVFSLPGMDYLPEKIIKDAMPESIDIDKIIDSISPLLGVISKTYWERPNELISIGLYISEIFQNHDNQVNIAHLEAQDSYYVDSYNLSHQTQMPVVELRDCADFGRISLKDYNDIGLLDESGSENLVSVSGAKAQKSTVNSCSDGIAVGYYSYATEEKMELFVPVNCKYILNMKGYSIKPYHTASFDASYQSVSANSDHRIIDEKGQFSDWYFMNTDFLQRSIDMNR